MLRSNLRIKVARVKQIQHVKGSMSGDLNFVYEKWYELFASKTLVDALLDRLKHRCITITINGPSLRNPASVPQKPAQPTS